MHSIEKNENQTAIQVIDTGRGIKNEDLEKIFTPLFSTKTEGNGLGLCEVNKMMLAQGAKVEVTSILDKGSVFSLVFLNTKPITH
jgi:signal transduction histidine kinase